MTRDGFVFYRSFYEALCCLDKDQQADAFKAVAEYALNGVEVELDGAAKGIFLAIKPQIDANNKRYLDGIKGAEYGKLGGRPKKNPIGVINENPIGVSEKTPKEKEKVKEKEKDKEKVKEKDKEKAIKKNTLAFYENVKSNYPLSGPLDSTLAEWCSYRDTIKKPLTEKSVIQLIEKTIGLERQYGYSAVKACFDNSLSNGYQGVFFDKIGKVTPIRNNKNEVDDFFKKELGL